MLREEGFSFQGDAKVVEGREQPGRDGQFRYIDVQAKARQAASGPVISVDMKEKEVGDRLRVLDLRTKCLGCPGRGVKSREAGVAGGVPGVHGGLGERCVVRLGGVLTV